MPARTSRIRLQSPTFAKGWPFVAWIIMRKVVNAAKELVFVKVAVTPPPNTEMVRSSLNNSNAQPDVLLPNAGLLGPGGNAKKLAVRPGCAQQSATTCTAAPARIPARRPLDCPVHRWVRGPSLPGPISCSVEMNLPVRLTSPLTAKRAGPAPRPWSSSPLGRMATTAYEAERIARIEANRAKMKVRGNRQQRGRGARGHQGRGGAGHGERSNNGSGRASLRLSALQTP
jgi:hypothetical protein